MSRVAGRDELVELELDVAEHRFLRDHLVDGRPLLPTVMALETIVCAVGLLRPDVPIAAVHNLRVGPPCLLPAEGRTVVSVSVSGTDRLYCALSSSDVVHVAAEVRLGTTDPLPRTEAVIAAQQAFQTTSNSPSTVGADLVYALYFHGRSFQIIDSARVDCQTARAQLARGLPPIVDPPQPSAAAPLLVELCLQAAGLWDLADSARMTIPLSIDRVRRFGDLDAGTGQPLTAVVTSRGGRSVFDAVVLDAEGVVQLAIDGYRTTPFPHPFDRAAGDRLRAALGSTSAVRGEESPGLG